MLSIKHFSGTELKEFFGDNEISSKLGFFVLEYFFTIYRERNYILLFDNDLIIGQISYLKKRNKVLLLSISITKNNQNKGYSKLLLNEYFTLLNNQKFLITEFSEEGELYIADYIFTSLEDKNIDFEFMAEKNFN